jgi:hypothetical protein
MTKGQFDRLMERFGHASFPEIVEIIREYEKLVDRFGEDKVIAVFGELAAITPLVNDIIRQTLEVSRLVMEQLPPPPSRRKRGRDGRPKGNYRQALVEIAALLASGQARSLHDAATTVSQVTRRPGTKTKHGGLVSTRTLENEFKDNFDSSFALIQLKLLATKDPDLFGSAHDEAVKNFLATGDILPEQEAIFERLMQIPPEVRAKWGTRAPDPTASIRARLIDETTAEVRRKVAKLEKTRPS